MLSDGVGYHVSQDLLALPGTMNVLTNYSSAARVFSPSSEPHISCLILTKKTRHVSFVHCLPTVVKTSTYRIYSHQRNSPHLGRVSSSPPQSPSPH